jgi:acetylornithine/N-succinyldiaminopimelate aminotransferase
MMKLKQIMQNDARYIGQTFSRMPVAFSRAEGAMVWDTDGKTYLDFFSGIAVNALGHHHPSVVEAMKTQVGRFVHSSNVYYNLPQIKLARLLCEVSFADKVFFANTGAEATELCLKMARKFGHPKGRYEIIAMANSFHGRTYGALSATGQEKFHKGFEPLLPGILHTPFNDLKALEKAIGPKTCAVLIEPIQGEGGVVEASADFLKGARKLCDKHNLLLILDEIQTGLGRTGKLFYYQYLGGDCLPDLMPLAKSLGGGLPLSAVLANKRGGKILGLGEHGTTMGGNPVACAAGTASLEYVLLHDLSSRAASMGESLSEGLNRLKRKYSFIKDVRGRGLMQGLEFAWPAKSVQMEALKQGLLINVTCEKVVRLTPPLIIDGKDLQTALDILDRVFKSPVVSKSQKKK